MVLKKRIQIYLKYIYLGLTIIFLIPFFIDRTEPKLIPPCEKEYCGEMYDTALAKLNSFEKLSHYIDSIYLLENANQPFDTAKYVSTIELVIQSKYYHNLVNYEFNENWMAYTFGKLFWTHFAAIVKPNDLVSKSKGICNQQTMVFLETLRLKNIPFRTVGLGYPEGPGHFLCEVFYGGDWHLYDVNLEPNWKKIVYPHQSLAFYLNGGDSLFKVYENKISNEKFNRLLTKVSYGTMNEIPAKKMTFFHNVTKTLTYLLPITFLFLFFRKLKRG